MAENTRGCYQHGAGAMANQVVTADLYSETRSAEITVGLYGVGDPQIYLIVEIKALSDDRTQVQTAYAFSSWTSSAAGVEGMLRGGTDCRPSSK